MICNLTVIGSIPILSTISSDNSIGRVSLLQGESCWFKSSSEHHGGMAEWIRLLSSEQAFVGSIPAAPTIFCNQLSTESFCNQLSTKKCNFKVISFKLYWLVAQLVERLIVNQIVIGSIPIESAILLRSGEIGFSLVS